MSVVFIRDKGGSERSERSEKRRQGYLVVV